MTSWFAGRPVGINSSVYRAGALALFHGEPLYGPLSALPPRGLDLPFLYPPFAAMVFFGRRQDAARAAATFGALCCPTESVRYWTSIVFNAQPPDGIARFDNQSLRGLLLRIFGDTTWASVLYLVLAALCVALAAILVRRHGDDPPGALLVTAGCALLISPISWINHWVWVVPLAAYLARAKHWLALAAVFGIFVFFTDAYIPATLATGIWLATRRRSVTVAAASP